MHERALPRAEAGARKRKMAAARQVSFVRRYDPSLPPIMADEDRIVQVFHNLMRNAIEAMAAGGIRDQFGPAGRE